MPKNYLEMFNDLVEEKEHQSKFSDKNDRILLLDGLNTFIRNFSVNPTTNDDGTHVGGLGFSKSIGKSEQRHQLLVSLFFMVKVVLLKEENYFLPTRQIEKYIVD